MVEITAPVVKDEAPAADAEKAGVVAATALAVVAAAVVVAAARAPVGATRRTAMTPALAVGAVVEEIEEPRDNKKTTLPTLPCSCRESTKWMANCGHPIVVKTP